MKKWIFILGLLVLIVCGGLYAKRKFYDPKQQFDNTKQLAGIDEIKYGDLIFQTSLSAQSKAIQLATKSKYSHCGTAMSFMFLKQFSPLSGHGLMSGLAEGKVANM